METSIPSPDPFRRGLSFPLMVDTLQAALPKSAWPFSRSILGVSLSEHMAALISESESGKSEIFQSVEAGSAESAELGSRDIDIWVWPPS